MKRTLKLRMRTLTQVSLQDFAFQEVAIRPVGRVQVLA